MEATSMGEIFGEAISVYTRAQAIEDGVLIDVSETAREAGITFPVALTEALHADIESIPAHFQGIQSYAGRLWDVLWLFRMAAAGILPHEGDGQCMVYRLIMRVGAERMYAVKAVCGPGDNAEPVITLMKPEEN